MGRKWDPETCEVVMAVPENYEYSDTPNSSGPAQVSHLHL